MLKIFFCFFLFICCTFNQGVWAKKHGRSKSNDDGKIVGGQNATIQNFPYQAYLLLQKGTDFYQCGGSIISDQYILTAAHCVQGISTAYIRIGSTYANTGGKQYVSTDLHGNPAYNPTTFDKDVAYIKVKMDLDGKNSKAVSLPSSGTELIPGTNVVVSGWGTTSENGQTSENLMSVTVPVVSDTQCRRVYSSLTSRMFCAGSRQGGKDSCQGDSGGPAVNKLTGRLVGVVSYGNGCARKGIPGVYTNIANPSIRSWISQNTGI